MLTGNRIQNAKKQQQKNAKNKDHLQVERSASLAFLIEGDQRAFGHI